MLRFLQKSSSSRCFSFTTSTSGASSSSFRKHSSIYLLNRLCYSCTSLSVGIDRTSKQHLNRILLHYIKKVSTQTNTIIVFPQQHVQLQLRIGTVRTFLLNRGNMNSSSFSTSSSSCSSSSPPPLTVVNSTSSASSNSISKIAVGQLTSTGDRKENLHICEKLAKKAAELGCKMLFLPECFSLIGNSAKDTVNGGTSLFSEARSPSSSWTTTSKEAEQKRKIEEDTSIINTCKKIAKENHLWISYGGFPEKIDYDIPLMKEENPEQKERFMGGKELNEGNGKDCNEKISSSSLEELPRKVYNTHLIINSEGELISYYRKIHLFDVAVPNGPILMESRYTEAGDKLVVVPESPIGVLGLSTCYDLRFPEMYRDLVLMGSEILLVPSAFTIPTGKAHWHILLKARAIETQCYVIAAAQVGQHNEKRASYGHSIVIDPWGKILAEAPGADSDSQSISESPNSKEGHYSVDNNGSIIITADIDLSYLQKIRTNMPLANHRRFDIFPSCRQNPHQSKI